MLKKFSIFIYLLSSIALGQSTVVSGTLVDSVSNTWTNASITATFYPTPGKPGPFIWSGGTLVPNPSSVSANTSGVFSITLPSNSAISPAGSQWSFSICPNASFQCVTLLTPVTSPTFDISALFTAMSTPPGLVYSTPIARAYNQNEILAFPPLTMGSTYFNTTSKTMLYWDGAAFQSFAGNGNATQVNGAGVPASAYFLASNAANQIIPGTNIIAQSVNGIQNAALYPGVDMGAQVNNAIAALPIVGGSNCGIVTVPYGAYTVSTKIVKPRCVMLDFDNSTLTSTIAVGPTIITGSNLDGSSGQYLWGGIKNLRLVGPAGAQSYGIWLGGDTTGTFSPAGYNDFGSSYTNINILNFTYGVAKGIAYQFTWLSSTLSGNTYGWYEPGQFGGENINLYGMQIVNNGIYGVYAPNAFANEFNCTSCSFDYNGSANIFIMNGAVTLLGGHMERCSGYDIDGPVTTSAAMQVNITGMTFVNIGSTSGPVGGCPTFSGTDTSYIHVTGQNSNVSIGKGVELVRNHVMSSLINWQTTGSSNSLNVEPYFDPGSTPGLATLLSGQAVNIQSLKIPLYDQFVSDNTYYKGLTIGQAQGGVFPGTGSIYTTGLIGTSINLSGSLPSPSSMPFGGGYIGWNATNGGDVDFLSPVPTSGTNNAYNFYVNNSGTFAKIFSIDTLGNTTLNSITLPNFGVISNTNTHFVPSMVSIGPSGAASTWFSFTTAPTGGCHTGDIGSNMSGGAGTSFYVCESGAWVGK